MDFRHFYIFLWEYLLINVPLDQGTFMFHFLFINFKICACGMYTHSTSILCAPPCQTYFFHTKFMLLKGDLLGFSISIDWEFEAWPMFETMSWVECTKKMINWCKRLKLYTCNILNYMLIVIFNANAIVHVLNTCFISLI